MIYTNKYNIPQYLVPWLTNDSYDYESDSFSATELMKPARAAILIEDNKELLTCDVNDNVASTMGEAIHKSIELSMISNSVLCEKRFYAHVDFDGVSYKISGKPDFILDGVIHDIKTTSVWSFIYGSKIDTYITQLSIYKWLLSANGIDTEQYGVIDMVFTDWSKAKSLQGGDYPRTRIVSFNIDLLSESDIISFIKERVKSLLDAGKSLPECTRDELWCKPDTWAVIKKGNKRATKVFDNEADAVAMADTDKVFTVEYRPGSVNRCNYCLARPFCEQAVELENKGLLEKDLS